MNAFRNEQMERIADGDDDALFAATILYLKFGPELLDTLDNIHLTGASLWDVFHTQCQDDVTAFALAIKRREIEGQRHAS